MALKVDLKTLPAYAKALIVMVPAILVTALVVFLMVMPKQKQIKALEQKIDEQNNEIASSLIKAEKLDVLKKENERLSKRLAELKEQLPAEKEISTLLKQVSDLGLSAGLEIISWRPGPKRDHPSGIVFEIPVDVVVTGKYHNLGHFFSNITKLQRIVNINDMKMGVGSGQASRAAKGQKGKISGSGDLDINFTAVAFSAVPDEEIERRKAEKGKK